LKKYITFNRIAIIYLLYYEKLDDTKKVISSVIRSRTDNTMTIRSRTDNTMTKRSRTDNTMTKRSRTDNTMTKRSRTDNTMTKRRRTDNTMTKRSRTDNTMTKRRTDNTMTKRSRTDNTMTKRKQITKGQTMIYKTLHRKLDIACRATCANFAKYKKNAYNFSSRATPLYLVTVESHIVKHRIFLFSI
jgi:hypothetical protein